MAPLDSGSSARASTTKLSVWPKYSPVISQHPGEGNSTITSIVHPPKSGACAFVGGEMTPSAPVPSSLLAETFRLDSSPGLKPELHKKSLSRNLYLEPKPRHIPSMGSMTASVSLPYQRFEEGNGAASRSSEGMVFGQFPES